MRSSTRMKELTEEEGVDETFGPKGAACILLIFLLVETGLSTRRQSVGWDEGDHIFAGYMNWKQGAYYLNPEHPPLVKLVATLPLLALDLKTAPAQGRYFKNEAYFGGRELLFRNAPQYGGTYDAATLMFRIHMATLIFAIGMAWLLFVAGREMFGSLAGLAAMALYVLDPSVLAQAPFVATDTAACCGFFAVTYLFYRFVKRMNWQRAAFCGLALGLALACKHSAIMLFPILFLLAASELAGCWRTDRRMPGREAMRMAAGLALTVVLALTVLWAVYGFRFAMHPSGASLPSLESEVQPLQAPMRGFLLFCQHNKLLPGSYIFGLADVQNVGISASSYIFDQIHLHGVWYYFPVLLTLKWTMGHAGAARSGHLGLRERPHPQAARNYISGYACDCLLRHSCSGAAESGGAAHPAYISLYLRVGGRGDGSPGRSPASLGLGDWRSTARARRRIARSLSQLSAFRQ